MPFYAAFRRSLVLFALLTVAGCRFDESALAPTAPDVPLERLTISCSRPANAVVCEALAHYADHCATCHANDGSGDTAIGRGLYPRVPDMRSDATQSLTDGELFSIIEHGIRLTGMPGWGNGTPEGERESWGLVHFVRRLPKLTDEDIERMEALNPKSPAQFKEEEEARRFLEGATVKPAGASPKDRRH